MPHLDPLAAQQRKRDQERTTQRLVTALQSLGCREDTRMTTQLRTFAHESEFDRYYFITPSGGLFVGRYPSRRMAAHLDRARLLKIADELERKAAS